MNRFLSDKWTKRVVFLLCLIPFSYLIRRGFEAWRTTAYVEWLTANPIEYITHFTGDWTIRFLLITLSITPLRMLLNLPQITRFRRMFGLFAFFYGSLHFSVWFGLDKFFSLPEMWSDVLKRPYITMGMVGFAGMVPLAITSTAGWVRRLTFKRWKKLHKLIYLTAVAAVIHYWWLVKSDIRLPLMYAAIVTVLLGYRVVAWLRTRKPVSISGVGRSADAAN